MITKQNVYHSVVRKDLGRDIIKLVDKYPVTYEVFIDGEAYTEKSYYDLPESILCYNGKEYETPERLDGLKNYIRTTRHPIVNIKDFMLDNSDNIECIDIIAPPEYREELHKLTEQYIGDSYITTSGSHLIEISSKASGKAFAFKKVAELLDVKLSEVVAFGDGDNDSELLRCAGCGVAVMNASKECKAAADMITDYNDRDGVFKALHKIFPAIV